MLFETISHSGASIMIDVKKARVLSASDERHQHESNGSEQRAFVDLLSRIKQKTARIGVIGLGYVGLPLARAFTDKGYSVLGFDTDANKVAKLQDGAELHRPHPGHGDSGDAGTRFRGNGGFPAARGTGCHHHLRSDPLDRGARTGSSLRDRINSINRSAAATRAARHPRKHDISWYHPPSGLAHPGSHRPQSRRRFLSGV